MSGPHVVHGVDVVSVSRVADLLAEFGASFRERVFTADERGYCERQGHPPQHYAARWAAKEAFLKTLAEASPGVPTDAIGVVRRDDGPHLSLAPTARAALETTLDRADVRGDAVDTAVSLSHDRRSDTAVGSVTICTNP